MSTFHHYSEMGPEPRVAALGNFDGIHLGHGELLRRVSEVAVERGLVPSVLTFHPHPVHVLAPAAGLQLIESVEARRLGLQEAGIQHILLQRFDAAFADLSAEAFVHEVLVKAMCVRHVVVGYDFGFGHKRGGSVKTLEALGPALGFAVDVIQPQTTDDGSPISSTRIRTALKRGDVDDARRCLGRPVSFSGIVVEGEQRGRKLGFPTANLASGHDLLLADGVYAAFCHWGEGERSAVVNIGLKPTFGGASKRSIEAHVLNERGLDLYGKKCVVRIVARLRSEQTFPSVEALKAQIQKDCARARNALVADH